MMMRTRRSGNETRIIWIGGPAARRSVNAPDFNIYSNYILFLSKF